MKIKELFLIEDDLTNKKEVLEWCYNKQRTGHLVFDGNAIGGISNEAPYEISCKRIIFSKTAIFKKPLPVQFKKVISYEVNNVKYLKNLSQLRVEEIESLFAEEIGIDSFENCPQINDKVIITRSEISSLKGLSKNVKELSISFCKNLTILDEHLPNLTRLTAPASGLTTLKDIHKLMSKLEFLQINACPITSNILGLLRLPNLSMLIYQTGEKVSIDFERACNIVDKYIQDGSRNIVACQKELYDNDLDEYAQL